MPGRARRSAVLILIAATSPVLSACHGAARSAPVSGSGADLYVAPDGSDTAGGRTPAAPLHSITAALQWARPGSTVYLRGGTYDEVVRASVHGTPGHLITLRDYPGETPVLSGSAAGRRHDQAGDVLVGFHDSSHLRISGLTFRDLTSVSYDGALLAVTGSGDDVTVDGCHFTATNPLYGRALSVTADTARPIGDLTITHNVIDHTAAWNGEALTLSGNIDGFVIAGNEVTAANSIAIDMKGGYPDGAGAGPDNATRNGRVTGNFVHDNEGDGRTTDAAGGDPSYTNIGAAVGIYVDGGRDILIKDNRLVRNDTGVVIGSEFRGGASERVTVQDNTFERNRYYGAVIGTVASFCDAGGCGKTDHVTFTGNTLQQDGTNGRFGDQASILIGTITTGTVTGNTLHPAAGAAAVRDPIGYQAGFTVQTS